MKEYIATEHWVKRYEARCCDCDRPIKVGEKFWKSSRDPVIYYCDDCKPISD